MSLPKQQAGFTLIEIMLFLAISGLMLVMATVGISQRTQNVQYTDSIRSIESYFNRQRTNVINGVNTRPDGMNCSESSDTIHLLGGGGEDVGRDLSCVVNGKEFVLDTADNKTIHTYDIATLNEEPLPSASHMDQFNDLVQGEKVGRIDNSHNPHGIDWQTTFIGAVEEGSSPPPIPRISFMFIRSTFSSQSYVYVSQIPGSQDDGRPLDPGAYTLQTTGYHLCFKSADETKVTDIFLNQGGTFELRSATTGPCEAIS